MKNIQNILELPKDMWEEAGRRQDASMVESPAWEDWIPEIIFQPFVVWPGQDDRKSIYVLTRDILNYLHEKSPRNIAISSQALSTAMLGVVLLPKEKCEGLSVDIKWEPAQIHRNGRNVRGYKIDFDGDPARHRAFDIISKMVADEKDPTAAYARGNRPF